MVVIHLFFAVLLDEKRKFSPPTFVDLFPFGTVARCRIHRSASRGVTSAKFNVFSQTHASLEIYSGLFKAIDSFGIN